MRAIQNAKVNAAHEALLALYNDAESSEDKEWYGGDLVMGVRPERLGWVIRDIYDILETLLFITARDPRTADIHNMAFKMMKA